MGIAGRMGVQHAVIEIWASQSSTTIGCLRARLTDNLMVALYKEGLKEFWVGVERCFVCAIGFYI